MVLTVPFDGFVPALERLGLSRHAWLWTVAGRTVISSGDLDKDILLQASTEKARKKIETELNDRGIDWTEGRWTRDSDVEELPTTSFWISAVAYKSAEDKPGLWVDATTTPPAAGEVIEKLYQEFKAKGVLGELSMEDFLKIAEPNVVVLDPEEQLKFATEQ